MDSRIAPVVAVFCATVLGVFILYSTRGGVVAAVMAGLLLLGVMGRNLARGMMKDRPVRAAYVMQLWLLAPVSTITLVTTLSTWVAVSMPAWLSIEATEEKIVGGVLVGAFNAMLAALWLDDAKNAQSATWPDAQYRIALQKAFAGDHRIKGNTRLFDAIYFDKVRQDGPKGWDLAARVARGKIIERALAGAP
ncbi:MAG: hypothetical protein KDE22_17140 [Rhodobacterales bacterium]|nr:hypothetical protein [Rhodobacterales bacterium]